MGAARTGGAGRKLHQLPGPREGATAGRHHVRHIRHCLQGHGRWQRHHCAPSLPPAPRRDSPPALAGRGNTRQPRAIIMPQSNDFRRQFPWDRLLQCCMSQRQCQKHYRVCCGLNTVSKAEQVAGLAASDPEVGGPAGCVPAEWQVAGARPRLPRPHDHPRAHRRPHGQVAQGEWTCRPQAKHPPLPAHSPLPPTSLS